MSEKVTFLDALANSAFTKQCGRRQYFIDCRLEEMEDNNVENEHRIVKSSSCGEIKVSRKTSVPANVVDRAVNLAGIETRVRSATGERVPAKQSVTSIRPGVVKRTKA